MRTCVRSGWMVVFGANVCSMIERLFDANVCSVVVGLCG